MRQFHIQIRRMTNDPLQLKYIVTVAAAGTISEAAKQLYIAQPSLTSAIKELENELGITIFKRTNKGILLSAEGEEFLGYARQVILREDPCQASVLCVHAALFFCGRSIC